MEFQANLRAQIEEKKALKDAEKEKLDREKQRELDHYLKHQYRGEVPVHENKRGGGGGNRETQEDYQEEEERSNRNNRRGGNNNNNGGGGGNNNRVRSPSPVNRRARAEEDEEQQERYNQNGRGNHGNHGRRNRIQEEEEEDPPRRGGGGGGNRRRRDYEEEQEEEQDYRAHTPPSNNLNNNQLKNKFKSIQQKAGGEKDVVSYREYNELTKLCEKLIIQQDTLAAEVAHQAEVIGVSNRA